MPVEIRELIIKTEIRTEDVYRTSLNNIDLNLFKNELLEDCKRMILDTNKRINYKR
tara:strand:- start:109320 stop:109487 length:168 start_codon:yes stop_codon:yes gene_type:complete